MEAEPLMLRYKKLYSDSPEMEEVWKYVPKQVLEILQNTWAQNGGIISDFSMLVTENWVTYVEVWWERIFPENTNVIHLKDVA